MKKLLLSLLLSVTLVQLCWAAVGPYCEHPATLMQHTGHHELQAPQEDAHQTLTTTKKNSDDAGSFCSSCEMQAGSLGYPARRHQHADDWNLPAPTSFTPIFTSHIPDHPEEPDWLALPSHGAAIRL